jgi:uncharacterized protein with FMN-binding domain
MAIRRAPIVIAATIAGTAAALGFHPSPATRGPVAEPPLPTTTAATPGRNGNVLGTDVPNKYGDVQVQVALRAGKLVDVRAVRLPNSDGKSQEISRSAGPALKQQALSAQSAKIDGVSGATYTSAGYRQSLQAAIDRAGTSQAATSGT